MSRVGDVVLWMPFAAPWRPHPAPQQLCCDAMRGALEVASERHATPFDCGATPLVYNAVFDEIGLVLRGEDAQYIVIGHCPWCAARLPESRRDAWFDTLEGLGFLDPNHQDVPDDFLGPEWRGSTS
ncbi:MAG: hypothetical protein AAGM38_18510 [Pseudomonadota bacterium]